MDRRQRRKEHIRDACKNTCTVGIRGGYTRDSRNLAMSGTFGDLISVHVLSNLCRNSPVALATNENGTTVSKWRSFVRSFPARLERTTTRRDSITFEEAINREGK